MPTEKPVINNKCIIKLANLLISNRISRFIRITFYVARKWFPCDIPHFQRDDCTKAFKQMCECFQCKPICTGVKMVVIYPINTGKLVIQRSFLLYKAIIPLIGGYCFVPIGTRGDQANEPLRDKSYLALPSNSLLNERETDRLKQVKPRLVLEFALVVCREVKRTRAIVRSLRKKENLYITPKCTSLP